jgi:hypothetical protein
MAISLIYSLIEALCGFKCGFIIKLKKSCQGVARCQATGKQLNQS